MGYKAAVRSANAGDFGAQANWDSGQWFLAIDQDRKLVETELAKAGC